MMRWTMAVAAFLCAAATPLPAVAAPNAPVVTPVTAADLGATWRTECPVGPADLRRVELSYTGFDGKLHRGALVLHRNVVEDVVAIFDEELGMETPARHQLRQRCACCGDWRRIKY